MKEALVLLSLLVALSVPAQTNPAPTCCRQPIRLFRAGRVDLTPLFQWWENQAAQPLAPAATNTAPRQIPSAAPALALDPAAARPLRAWKHITGRKTGEFYGAWVVAAVVATSPIDQTNEWILLANPPTAESDEFDRLQSLIADDDDQITNDISTYQARMADQAKAAARAHAAAQGFKWIRQYVDVYQQQAAQAQVAAADALADQQDMEDARAELQTRLAALPAAADQYQVDCFALEVGRNRLGQLVFDLGKLPDDAP
jgi:hypothetical protein